MYDKLEEALSAWVEGLRWVISVVAGLISGAIAAGLVVAPVQIAIELGSKTAHVEPPSNAVVWLFVALVMVFSPSFIGTAADATSRWKLDPVPADKRTVGGLLVSLIPGALLLAVASNLAADFLARRWGG